jgi:hypothetical protein
LKRDRLSEIREVHAPARQARRNPPSGSRGMMVRLHSRALGNRTFTARDQLRHETRSA